MTHKQRLCWCVITSCVSNLTEKKKILCIPLITSDMIFRGITELECIDNSLPSSFYLCYHKPSEVTNLHSFILHLQSHSKSMQLSETAVIDSLLLNSAISFVVLFNEFENFLSFIFRHGNIFSKIPRFFFSPERNHFSAINDSLLMWKVAFMHS